MQAELGIRPVKTEEQKNEEMKKRAEQKASGKPGDNNEKEHDDDREMQAILTPAERSRKYYERAKAFYTQSGGSSLELEIVTRDVVAASAYSDDLKLYYFLAKIFKQNLDFSSCIYALRNALRLDITYKPARKMIAEVLLLKAREIMGEATLANQQLQQAKKIAKIVAAQREKQDKAREEAKVRAARVAASQKMLDILKDGPKSHSTGDNDAPMGDTSGLESPMSKPVADTRPSFKIPRKFDTHVNLLYKNARVHFDECLEYDRDNYNAILFKGVCHVQANELQEATDALVRAGHLINVQLKQRYPIKKSAFTSKSSIENSKQVLNALSDNIECSRGGDLRDDGATSAAVASAIGGPKADSDAAQAGLTAPDHEGTSYIYNETLEYESEEIAAESRVLTRKLAEVLILRAKIYWGQGLNESGNAEMRKASTIVSDHPEVKKFGLRSYVRAEKIYGLCLNKFRLGEFEEAYQLIQNAVTLSSQDIKLFIMQAKLQRNLGDVEAAFKSIQNATNLYQSAGDGTYEMKIPEEIIKETSLIFNDKALQCAASGDYDKSVALLNRAIQAEINLNKNNKVAEAMLAGLSVSDTNATLAAVGASRSDEPNETRGHGMGLLEVVDYRFLINRGDCLRAQHKYGLALIDYDAALASLKLRKMGASSGLEGARRQWNVTTRLSLTHYLVACDYFNENAYEDAERQLCLAVDYNPKVSEYYHARGRARYYIGRHQEAYEDFKATYALDPGNTEVILRLKQFEANHPGVVVSTTVEAAGMEGVSATKKPTEEGMTIEEARNNPGAVPPIPVSDDDTLTALLHATTARNLPLVAAQLKAQKAIRAAIPVRKLDGESGAPEDRLYGNEALARLNPGMTIAAVAAIDRDTKCNVVKSIMTTKPDVNKATVWTAVSNAKKSAQLVSKPAPGSRAAQEASSKEADDDLETVVSAGGTTRKVQKSYTVSGLKRFSQKQTAKALREGGLVKGVLTHHSDPFVLAYEAEQAARGEGNDGTRKASSAKSAITINITARPRHSKWSKKSSTNVDDGGVETFQSYDRMRDMVKETESGNWRVKLEKRKRPEKNSCMNYVWLLSHPPIVAMV